VLLRRVAFPDFCEPCLPSPAEKPPAGARPVAALGQDEEPGRARGEAGGGGGLDEMTRRKREIMGLRNERDFPHLVELALPPEGFRSVLLEIDAFVPP